MAELKDTSNFLFVKSEGAKVLFEQGWGGMCIMGQCPLSHQLRHSKKTCTLSAMVPSPKKMPMKASTSNVSHLYKDAIPQMRLVGTEN